MGCRVTASENAGEGTEGREKARAKPQGGWGGEKEGEREKQKAGKRATGVDKEN